MSNIIPVIHTALTESGVKASDLDAIAYTQGPGLMGSLLVGIHAAKGLSIALGAPLMGVNHLQAHIAAIYIEHPKPEFPILCLLVSGGHTRLILVKDYMEMETIGSTIDDAAGEAFDKAAKLLGLPYPGGPHIDSLAAKGNPLAFNFPDAKVPHLDFSFSGIKTSLLYFVRDHLKEKPDFIEKNLFDICASYQHCIIRYLLSKTQKAIEIYKPASIALAGGVSANSQLRKQFLALAQTNSTSSYIPSFEYCTDNAAMIASAGHYLLESGAESNLNALPFSR
jgi:N6-L-threonylcarbamoyladenine synthase